MIYNIQMLRAVAALLVVCCHLDFLPGQLVPNAARGIGQGGVDIFFVISGFVMVHTMQRKPVTAGTFMLNRIIRVVPLYWFATLALVLLGLFLGRFHHPGGAHGSIIRSLLFIPYLDPLEGRVPVLFVGWTLNYEMAFYAVMALAVAASAARVERMVALVCGVLLAMAAVGWIWSPSGVTAAFYTDDITLEFGAGMVLAVASARGFRLPTGLAVPLAAAAAGALAAAMYHGWPHRGLVAGLPALLIVASAVSLERDGHAATGPATRLLGASSYALYLVHPIVLQLLVRDHYQGYSRGGPALLALGALGIAACLAAGIGLHLLVERPLTRLVRRLFDRRAAPRPPLAARAAP